MPTITLTVNASNGDARQSGTANDSGRNITNTAAGTSITETILSPGSHNGNDEWSVGARFTAVTIPQGATINSASFSMKAQASYNAGANVVAYLVSAQAADNPGVFTGTSGDLATTGRPRTTAVSAQWTQTSVTGGTRYSIDITSVIQEIVNRAGWASGNAIVILVDTHANTTVGEWQDYYAWDDATDRTNNPPQLVIDYTSGGGDPEQPPSTEVPRTRRASNLTTVASNLLLTTLIAAGGLPVGLGESVDGAPVRRPVVSASRAASAPLVLTAATLPPGRSAFPPRPERRVRLVVDSQSVPSEDAVAPLQPAEWPLTPRRRTEGRGFTAHRPVFLAEPVAVPFTQDEWPNPPRVRLAGQGHRDGIIVDETDPMRPSGAQALPPRRAVRVPEPVGSLQSTTLAAAPATTPVGEAAYPAVLSRRRSMAIATDSRPQDDALTPVAPLEWPVTRRPRNVSPSVTQARPSFYSEPAVTLPFTAKDWPSARRQPVQSTAFVSALALTLGMPVAAPFDQTDWPRPHVSRRPVASGFIGYFGIDDSEPLPNGRLEAPDQLSMARRAPLAPASANLTLTTLATASARPVGASALDRPVRRPAFGAVYADSLLTDTLSAPPVALPAGEAVYPATLPRRRAISASADSRPQEDAAVPVVPFDWPASTRTREQLRDRSFVQGRPQYYVDPPVVLPFRLQEWTVAPPRQVLPLSSLSARLILDTVTSVPAVQEEWPIPGGRRAPHVGFLAFVAIEDAAPVSGAAQDVPRHMMPAALTWVQPGITVDSGQATVPVGVASWPEVNASRPRVWASGSLALALTVPPAPVPFRLDVWPPARIIRQPPPVEPQRWPHLVSLLAFANVEWTVPVRRLPVVGDRTVWGRNSVLPFVTFSTVVDRSRALVVPPRGPALIVPPRGPTTRR